MNANFIYLPLSPLTYGRFLVQSFKNELLVINLQQFRFCLVHPVHPVHPHTVPFLFVPKSISDFLRPNFSLNWQNIWLFHNTPKFFSLCTDPRSFQDSNDDGIGDLKGTQFPISMSIFC